MNPNIGNERSIEACIPRERPPGADAASSRMIRFSEGRQRLRGASGVTLRLGAIAFDQEFQNRGRLGHHLLRGGRVATAAACVPVCGAGADAGCDVGVAGHRQLGLVAKAGRVTLIGGKDFIKNLTHIWLMGVRKQRRLVAT